MVALALGCGVLIEHLIGLQSVLLVFLMAVVGAAIRWGLFPSLFACVLSVLAFNFFLVPPLHTLAIADPENALALLVFFVVALIVSNLTAALRSQIAIAQWRAGTTAALYAFSRRLAGIGTLDELLRATTRQVSTMLDVSTALLLPDPHDGAIELAGAHPPEYRLDAADLAAARRCWERAGAGDETRERRRHHPDCF